MIIKKKFVNSITVSFSKMTAEFLSLVADTTLAVTDLGNRTEF